MKTIKAIISASALALFIILLGQAGASADGFIVIPRPGPGHRDPFPLEVKYHHVSVDIRVNHAVTSIDQEFYNPTGSRLEGEYIFPLPPKASIRKFSMFINGRETEAELLDAKKAKQIYEDIVRKMRDPALLEYRDRGLFRVRIYPIEPGSTKRVKITYSEQLRRDSGTWEYRYPLNTEKFSAKPLAEAAVKVDLHTEDPLRNIYCTSHVCDIERKGSRRALISYQARKVKPDTDFVLCYSTSKSGPGLSILPYREKGGKGYFFMDIHPGHDRDASKVQPRDITFVLDTSGSMAGEKLEKATSALLFCVNSLNSGDRFQVIRFSTEAEALFPGLEHADRKNRARAAGYIREFRAAGGTNIEEALALALSSGIRAKRTHTVLFITDGKPTVGETAGKKLASIIGKKNPGNTRIFTFGIGYSINTHLLDRLTEMTGAFRTYITPGEDIEKKISDFYSKVRSPVMTDLKVHISPSAGASMIYPRRLPDLFRGSSLVLAGRYRGAGPAIVRLSGMVSGSRKTWTYRITLPVSDREHDFVPRVWASRRAGHLLDMIRLNGESRELVDELTALAREHGIITPYTSYLILEDERSRVSRNSIDDESRTLSAIVPRYSAREKMARQGYLALRKKSGEKSVTASRDIDILKRAGTGTGKITSGRKFYEKPGHRPGRAAVKTVSGRAVYFNGLFWVDSEVPSGTWKKKTEIVFGSREYFRLIERRPDSAGFLSLGRNVKFILGNILYVVREQEGQR